MMDIREIFENYIKIEQKQMSIETIFHNEERVNMTDYKPSYQRNYVWDDEKATYFIESILLGTEIPPLIYFRKPEKIEVIDGRQRYQTILRFLNNEFKLRKNGLQKLENIGIANKSFRDIGDKLQDLFWDTKLRIIEFSFHSKNLINDDIEELVKKEIFKRYNSGITPLKPTEIDKAAYIKDDLNTYIKESLQNDKILYRDVTNLLYFEKSNLEILLKKIRQLLVQHRIPIKYYSNKKDTIISKYYEFLFANISDQEIDNIYTSFIEKINLLKKIKNAFAENNTTYNRLISECLYWAFSILEAESHSLQEIDNSFIDQLVSYINANIESFKIDRSSFSKELFDRYTITSKIFADKFGIDFNIYLLTTPEFKEENKETTPKNSERMSFDELRINKPEPSSSAIVDISRQMGRQRFLIRPSYQRDEVINKKKSSSIIESILLGIKLPPIFIYKRSDDISEVLDGQQRLLSILGFLEEPYLDENNKKRKSEKDGYALNLKNGILSNLHGKRFKQLTADEKNKIKNSDLWIIEISEKNNKDFEPIDLFIRLNNKPYPIKEDTFEMWNSYVSRNIIETIKSIHKNSKDWFYFRKNNSRMEDENIYTSLTYLEFSVIKKGYDPDYVSKDLDIYQVVDKINFRVKSKNEITKVLEDASLKEEFIFACNQFEFNFIKKLKELVTDEDDSSSVTLNKNLDYIFNIEKGKRTQQSFYALWFFLYDVPGDVIIKYKNDIREKLRLLFKDMAGIKSKSDFDINVQKFRKKYTFQTPKNVNVVQTYFAEMGEISQSHQGVTGTISRSSSSSASKDKYSYPYRRTRIENYNLKQDETVNINLAEKPALKDFFDAKPKFLIKKTPDLFGRLQVAYTEERLALPSDIYVCLVERPGFLIKYVIAIASSRYAYYSLVKGSNNINNDDLQISLTELKKIPIPVLPIKTQGIFSQIVDYIRVFDGKNEVVLFFERILDAMAYEIFFPDQMRQSESNVLRYLQELPELAPNNNLENIEIVQKLYKILSNANHTISGALLKLMNVDDVMQIEYL